MSKHIPTEPMVMDSQDKLTDSIKIDFESIPEHVREDIASATLEAVQKFISQPGGREYLDQKKALRKEKIEAQ